MSPSNEYSGLISFRIDWFDLLAVQEILKSLPTLTVIHDYWKNHSFDYVDLCWQSDVCFLMCCLGLLGFPGGSVVKNPPAMQEIQI